MSGRARESSAKSSTIQLPNIPKMMDDKSRIKYMMDYEKYEHELLKHHLGSAESTTTLGLKELDTDFSRRVPALTEPTAAEREYERRVQLKAQKARSRRFFDVPRPRPHPTPHLPPLPQYSSIPHDVVRRTPPTAADRVDDELAAASVRSGSDQVSLGAAHSTRSAARTSAAIVPRRAPQPTSPLRRNASRDAPRVPKLSPRPTSPAHASSTHRASPPSVVHMETAQEVESALAHDAPLLERLYAPLPRDPHRNDDDNDAGGALRRCAAELRLVLRPPSAYVHSFDVELTGMGVEWVLEDVGRPGRLVTLHDALHVSRTGDVANARRLNSPRSVLILLRHGVRLSDLDGPGVLAETDVEDDVVRALGEDAREVREGVRRYRAARAAARRQQLRAELLADYTALCQVVPLQDFLHALRSAPESDVVQPDSTSTTLLVQQARQTRVLERHRVQLERQVERAAEAAARAVSAEQRQAQVREAARTRAARTAAAEAAARLQHAEHVAAQQQSLRARAQAQTAQLRERLSRAEQRREERVAVQTRRLRARQERAKLRARERAARVARATQTAREQAARELQRRLQRQDELDRARAARAERAGQVSAERDARRRRAHESRTAALQRAAATAALLRQAALAQQERVTRRLHAFELERDAQRARRSSIERARAVRRQAAYDAAVAAAAERRDRTLAKQHAQEVESVAMRRARAVAALVAREHERERAAAVQFARRRRGRAREFDKVRAVARLVEKGKVAEAVERQREALLAATHAARAQLTAQMAQLKETMAQTTP